MPRTAAAVIVVAIALMGCSGSRQPTSVASSDPSLDAWQKESAAVQQSCFREADKAAEGSNVIRVRLADGRVLQFPQGTSPEVVQRTVDNVLSGKTVLPATGSHKPRLVDGWDTVYWTCMKREDGILAVKYGVPQDDLDEFSYSYHIATARRADAGIITNDEAKAEHRRISDAVLAERHRRAAEEQAAAAAAQDAADADRRAASLSALAIGLGAIVHNQPPPPETTLYNFGGTAVTCTRWQNVVNCF